MTDTLRIRPMCADDPERIAAEEPRAGLDPRLGGEV